MPIRLAVVIGSGKTQLGGWRDADTEELPCGTTMLESVTAGRSVPMGAGAGVLVSSPAVRRDAREMSRPEINSGLRLLIRLGVRNLGHVRPR
jgi:hypothetical protein